MNQNKSELKWELCVEHRGMNQKIISTKNPTMVTEIDLFVAFILVLYYDVIMSHSYDVIEIKSWEQFKRESTKRIDFEHFDREFNLID